MSSYYDILEIDRNSEDSDIKRAYRRKSLLYHPDRPNGDAEKFKQISLAYETLVIKTGVNNMILNNNCRVPLHSVVCSHQVQCRL